MRLRFYVFFRRIWWYNRGAWLGGTTCRQSDSRCCRKSPRPIRLRRYRRHRSPWILPPTHAKQAPLYRRKITSETSKTYIRNNFQITCHWSGMVSFYLHLLKISKIFKNIRYHKKAIKRHERSISTLCFMLIEIDNEDNVQIALKILIELYKQCRPNSSGSSSDF